MAKSIESFYGNSFEGIPISYAREESPLGTGGAIRAALEKTTANDVVIFNGDSLSITDLTGMMKQHCSHRERVSIALCHVPDTSRYGSVQVADDHIVAFSEKGIPGPGYINAGIYILQRDVFAGLGLPETFSFEQQFLAANLVALSPAAFTTPGPFIDIGVPEDYARAQVEPPPMVGL
jgi:D-glycero-alpha-D-manno-heptose 1-phosphate guanylyltransferase